MKSDLQGKEEHIKFRFAVYMVLSFVLFLWCIKALELSTGISLARLGILPRTAKGLIGIVTGPLIHGDVLHLLSNSLPLMVLGFLLFYFYYRIALEIFLWIYLVTGFWIWLLARNAYHIGASGVVYGMATFLFFSGIIRKDRRLMTLSGIVIFLYGGMMYGMFPGLVAPDVSWEAHLLGAVAGVILAFVFRKEQLDFASSRQVSDEMDDYDAEDHENARGHQISTSDDVLIYHFKPTKKKES